MTVPPPAGLGKRMRRKTRKMPFARSLLPVVLDVIFACFTRPSAPMTSLTTSLPLSFGFDYQLVTSGKWLGPTLAKFVAQRNAKIKKGKMG